VVEEARIGSVVVAAAVVCFPLFRWTAALIWEEGGHRLRGVGRKGCVVPQAQTRTASDSTDNQAVGPTKTMFRATTGSRKTGSLKLLVDFSGSPAGEINDRTYVERAGRGLSKMIFSFVFFRSFLFWFCLFFAFSLFLFGLSFFLFSAFFCLFSVLRKLKIRAIFKFKKFSKEFFFHI
jgi:hypothetical protein